MLIFHPVIVIMKMNLSPRYTEGYNTQSLFMFLCLIFSLPSRTMAYLEVDFAVTSGCSYVFLNTHHCSNILLRNNELCTNPVMQCAHSQRMRNTLQHIYIGRCKYNW